MSAGCGSEECARLRRWKSTHAPRIEALEGLLSYARAEAAKGAEAIATLASEREANAILTAEVERLGAERLDLSLLVGRLIRRMRIARAGQGMAAGDDALEEQAIGYLRRKGLVSPLRASPQHQPPSTQPGTPPSA